LPVISVILLGMAVSIDGFGVGFSYGLRRVHIPPLSLFIICLSSAVSVFISMLAGSGVAEIFGTELASLLGGMMLILVGIFIIKQAVFSKGVNSAQPTPEKPGLALLSAILQAPEKADFDHSGEINAVEAVVLGVALALDAFGTGFGAALMGFTPLSVSLAVGIAKFIFLTTGTVLGRQYAQKFKEGNAAVIAGIVLMLLGIKHVFSKTYF